MVDLSLVQHKVWEASRLRALNEVLGVGLQPEELLLEAMEAPWRDEDGEKAGEVQVEERVALQPGGATPKRLRGKNWEQGGAAKQQRGKRRRVQRGEDGQEQRRGMRKWCLPRFNVDPGHSW